MTTETERKKVADEAIRKAEIEKLLTERKWRLEVVGNEDAVSVFFVDQDKELHPPAEEVIAALMFERDMWKRRAEKHGCNTTDGDPDCG